MFAGGVTYSEIAAAAGIRTTSVRNAIYRIQYKLAVNTKQELILWTVRNGLPDEREE